MSLISWKKEFYGKPASKVKTPKEAILHSIRKWEGLSKKNIAKHGAYMEPAASSCAMCRIYVNYDKWDSCEECPLYIVRNGLSCDSPTPREILSPFNKFYKDRDARPMQSLLKRAFKYMEKKGFK